MKKIFITFIIYYLRVLTESAGDHSIIRLFPNDCFSFFRLFSVSSITSTIFVNTINFETLSLIFYCCLYYILIKNIHRLSICTYDKYEFSPIPLLFLYIIVLFEQMARTYLYMHIFCINTNCTLCFQHSDRLNKVYSDTFFLNNNRNNIL